MINVQNVNHPKVVSKSAKIVSAVADEEVEPLDDAIINGLKGVHKDFCLGIEKTLKQFTIDTNREQEVIYDLDKYQRKIVHKMCDIFYVDRNVNMKPDDKGDMILIRTPDTKSPQVGLQDTLKHFEEKTKPAPKKVIGVIQKKAPIKLVTDPNKDLSKQMVKLTLHDPSSGGDEKGFEIECTPEEAEKYMQKQKDYELRKAQLFGTEPVEEKPIIIAEPLRDSSKKKDSKRNAVTDSYDPAYDRSIGGHRPNPNAMYMGPPPFTPQNPMYGGMPGMMMPPHMNMMYPPGIGPMGGYSMQGHISPQQPYYQTNFPPMGGSNYPPLRPQPNNNAPPFYPTNYKKNDF